MDATSGRYKKARLKVAFETSHYNPRYHSNCAFAPLRDSIKSFALTRHHGIPYLLARRNRRKFQVISSEGMGPLISPLPIHTTHRLSESINIGLSSSSLLRFILLNCPHCSAFLRRCQQLFSFFTEKGATKTSSLSLFCILIIDNNTDFQVQTLILRFPLTPPHSPKDNNLVIFRRM